MNHALLMRHAPGGTLGIQRNPDGVASGATAAEARAAPSYQCVYHQPKEMEKSGAPPELLRF